MLTTFSGRNASQNEDELRPFIQLLRDGGCRRYCEIGARHGDTFVEVMRGLPAGSAGAAVDLPGGPWGQAGTERALERACTVLRAEGYRVVTIYGDSQQAETEDAIYSSGPFDAVLIDADHSYDGVRIDWLRYANLAPLVAFHDIVGEGEIEKRDGRPVEVPRLWAEIKAAGFVTTEFVAPGSKMGIGCVWPRAPREVSAA